MVQRYVRFDATRAFYLATLAIALMGGSFAVGLRLGQDMPGSLESVFSGPVTNDVASPVLAPEQLVPVETYTFYDSQRELERDPTPRAAPPAPEPAPEVQRVIGREPVVIAHAEPSAEPAAAPSHEAPAEIAAAEDGSDGQEFEPSEEPQPAAEMDPAEAPTRIERQTVVRSMDDIDGF